MSRPKIDKATRERLGKVLDYLERAPAVAKDAAKVDALNVSAVTGRDEEPNHSYRLGALEQMVRNTVAELRAVLG